MNSEKNEATEVEIDMRSAISQKGPIMRVAKEGRKQAIGGAQQRAEPGCRQLEHGKVPRAAGTAPTTSQRVGARPTR
jgi:hypothetical protein